MILAAMGGIAYAVPRWQVDKATAASESLGDPPGYAEIWRSPYFRKMSPLAFFNYGGLVAIQTLWAGPWMVQVAGYTPLKAATGLFYINAAMLCTFWGWGLVNPRLARRQVAAVVLATEPGSAGRAGLVSLQPGDFFRRVLCAVGHWPGH